MQLFISAQNYFSCNTKILFRTLFRMLCHGDIFLLSHSKKNIITCQKTNKLSFLCDAKKIISFFVHHRFFIFSFYITNCQHVDLCSGLGNKETFNPSFTHLSDIYIPKQLLSKSFSRKKGVLLSRFVCKAAERSSYFSQVAGLFLANFAKINTVKGIFQGFYLGFKPFSIVCNISRRHSNGRFPKF